MLAAVEFDDKPPVEACEVADVESDLMLSSELESRELATTESAPEEAFGVSRIFSQASGV